MKSVKQAATLHHLEQRIVMQGGRGAFLINQLSSTTGSEKLPNAEPLTTINFEMLQSMCHKSFLNFVKLFDDSLP